MSLRGSLASTTVARSDGGNSAAKRKPKKGGCGKSVEKKPRRINGRKIVENVSSFLLVAAFFFSSWQDLFHGCPVKTLLLNRHGLRRQAIHEFLLFLRKKLVDVPPSRSMTKREGDDRGNIAVSPKQAPLRLKRNNRHAQGSLAIRGDCMESRAPYRAASSVKCL